MRRPPYRLLSVVGLLSAAAVWSFAGAPAQAGPADYVWEAIDPYPPRQVGVVLKVRLRDLAGRPQAEADILDARFDKSPDGQPGAYAPVTVLPTSENGIYAFKTSLNTDGRYALTVSAKLPYETAPITGSVVFTTPRPPPSATAAQAAPVRP